MESRLFVIAFFRIQKRTWAYSCYLCKALCYVYSYSKMFFSHSIGLRLVVRAVIAKFLSMERRSDVDVENTVVLSTGLR
jgi:hypothetical protein